MIKASHIRTAIMAIALVTSVANAQLRNVLLEQHTGAWCGWCPDGTVKMDEILDLYGDQVIGVKLHTGDAMEISQHSIIADNLGLTGVPSGSIDRKNFGGSVFLSRGSWKSTCEFQMERRAKAEVDCFYTLDRNTRVARIQVVANIADAMDFPLRFNIFVVEDNVTGSGSGYDQVNYYSNRPGYQSHPYFYEPPVITGYHHMKVVRKMLGGAWGVSGDLGQSVQAGEFYSYEFTTTIDQRWKIEDLFFVGVLQANASGNKEIINSAVAIEDGSLLNRIIDSDAPAARVLPSGSDFSNSYTLENVTDRTQTYEVTLSKTEKTPRDWTAEFTSGNTKLTATGTNHPTSRITIPANSTIELSLALKMGMTLGIGDAKVTFELQGSPTITRSRMISAITSDMEKLLLESGSSYSLRPYINAIGHSDIITLDPSDYMDFANQLTNIKLVIWNKGPFDTLSPKEVEVIKSNSNINHFICGDGVVFSLYSTNSSSYFGVEYIGWNLEGQSSNGRVWLSGQDGDVITDSLGEHIEGQLIYYYIDVVRITDTHNVFPIMHFQNDGIRQRNNSLFLITADDAIFGVRTIKNNSKIVILGISPYVLVSERNRRELLESILNWLVEEGDGGSDGQTPSVEGFETGNLNALDWLCLGDADWLVTRNDRNSGSYSAQSGPISNNQTTSLHLSLNCIDGEIKFYYKVSSESGFDFLTFYIDGVEQDKWSGEDDWTEVSFPVMAGTRQFEWTYSKDSSGSDGEDCARIDDIVFPVASSPEPPPTPPPPPGPTPDADLVGWWKLDESSGTIARDSSGHGNDGTLQGNPRWVTGKIDRALQFDGSGDRVDCGKDPTLNLSNAVTITAWIKPNAIWLDQKIAGNQDNRAGGYKMGLYRNNKVEFAIRTSSNQAILNRGISGGTVFRENVWHHVAGVYSFSGRYIRTYVDGELDRQLVTSERLSLTSGAFILGSEPFTNLRFWNGIIDDVRVYKRALTTQEIQAITTAPSPGPPKGRACFTADTLVWINGRFIPISQVAPGQVISSMYADNRRIEEVQEHSGIFTCYDILVESGNSISVAECHYFMTESGHWCAVQELKTGTKLKTSEGTIRITNIIKRQTPYAGTVFNLKIDSSDQYHVGTDRIIVRDY